MKATERLLGDWLGGYMEYSDETESAKIYRQWVAISVIASALRRKISFKLGRLKTDYPNFYIVLVGPPGTGKTEAINFGFKLANKLEDIFISGDAVTREQLIQDIEASPHQVLLNDGSYYTHQSMTAICSELEVFLGDKKENSKMLSLLTTLWDCPDLWKYRTKGAGKNTLDNVWLNLIGATTPDSLAKSLPTSAHGTGFTARIVFCYAKGKDKKVPYPEETERTATLFKALEHDLAMISMMYGRMEFSKEARRFWDDWYNTRDDRPHKRICPDKSFDGWYERKPTTVRKLAMIVSASESNDLTIEKHHIERTIEILNQTEISMTGSFSSMGRNDLAGDIDLIMNMIREKGEIKESDIVTLTWNDLNSDQLDSILKTICKTGKVVRDYNFRDIVYKWRG